MGDDDGSEPQELRRILGFEFYRDYCTAGVLWRRWRVWLHNPRWIENWRIDWIFDDGVWQIGIGPLMLVYSRKD